MVVLPTTDGDRIVIVDYYISGVVPKSLSSLDAKRVLYPVNDIKVLYEYMAKNVTNFLRYPQKAVPLQRKPITMIYIQSFQLPSAGIESSIYNKEVSRLGDSALRSSIYPLGVFRYRIEEFHFSDITIFYGGNGTGKSTAINIISRRLQALDLTQSNDSDFFAEYVRNSRPIYADGTILSDIRIRRIASDDVFQFLLQKRDQQQARAQMIELLNRHYKDNKWRPIGNMYKEQYQEWVDRMEIQKKSRTQYKKGRVGREEPEMSNGECAMQYFTNSITDNSIIFLDEPENSLSAEWQVRLASFLAQVPRGFRCQLIIATHSPFLLALPGARIYDFETEEKEPILTKRWTELKNVRVYRDFFHQHENEF